MLCEWKHPRAFRIALIFDGERATRAVLSFLRHEGRTGGHGPLLAAEAEEEFAEGAWM